jgi:HEPN/Toprim N-terminal domain 1
MQVGHMGSMIHLSVGRLEIDWGKNNGFTDHSGLFQPTDVTNVPYYYAGDEYVDAAGEKQWKILIEKKEGLSKKLNEVGARIELLGYTLKTCRKEFMCLADLNDFDSDVFRFDDLRNALATVDVGAIKLDYGAGDDDFGEFFREQIYPKLGMEKLPADDARRTLYSAAEGMENLSSHSILRLLADNSNAADLPVIWTYKDVEDGGWAKHGEFVRPLEPSNKFLIVTEGSSDAAILQHAFRLLRPHIADFFSFVDMEEGYPFSGTGNLYKFVQGLISIGVQNNAIILFDNDAEGVFGHERCRRLNVPANMKVLRLPDIDSFRQFKTMGPDGEHVSDINGKAAAIECYLDFGDQGVVRWNNFNEGAKTYQGELVGKDRVKNQFLGHKSRETDYDYSKIEIVLDLIVANCVAISEARQIGILETQL